MSRNNADNLKYNSIGSNVKKYQQFSTYKPILKQNSTNNSTTNDTFSNGGNKHFKQFNSAKGDFV